MKRVFDWVMWLMFLVSFISALLTMLVVFGGSYIRQFTTFLPMEISLAATFILWGINSLINPYTRNSKNSFYYAFLFGTILVGFAALGIY
jgi:hypothetical protein